jgi:sugar lactone lactonase YvrE
VRVVMQQSNRSGRWTICLLAVLAVLGGAQAGRAAGTWLVISLPQQAGEVNEPAAVAVDALGNLYVAEGVYNYGRIQKRDAQGNWSILATAGDALGQVSEPYALTADPAGDLYVADRANGTVRIQKRDAQGGWSMVTIPLPASGQAPLPTALAVDGADNLYVAESYQIQKRDAHGNWSVMAAQGASAIAVDSGGKLYVADYDNSWLQVRDAKGTWSTLATERAFAIAADAAGNLYVAERPAPDYASRIRKRDAQGSWSVIAAAGGAPGQVNFVLGLVGLAVGAAGDLYVAASTLDQGGRIQRRDTQGSWSVIAAPGQAPGQVPLPSALAVDAAGNLYVVDQSGGGRIQRRDVHGSWSVFATAGDNLGQVHGPTALTVDAMGTLYVADNLPAGNAYQGRIQSRDARGDWSIIGTGSQLFADALAADATGSLYAADIDQIRKRDAQGHWFTLASYDQVSNLAAIAVGTGGDLYAAESWNDAIGSPNRIQKRDAQGNWSVIAGGGSDPGQVSSPTALTMDRAGNLYVADRPYTDNGDPIGDRIQKRDAQGNWSVLATGSGLTPGQFLHISALAADAAGNLYVADTYNDRVQVYSMLPGP